MASSNLGPRTTGKLQYLCSTETVMKLWPDPPPIAHRWRLTDDDPNNTSLGYRTNAAKGVICRRPPPVVVAARQPGGSDPAGECAQLIGDVRFSLNVERGERAPAREPPDEIGCGPGQYGTGPAIGAGCPFVAIGRANN